MKLFIYYTLLSFSLSISAASNPEITNNCRYMSLKKDDVVITLDNQCILKLKKDGKLQELNLPKCPRLFKNKQVYAWSNVERMELDYLEITTSKHCDQKLYRNLGAFILGYGQNETDQLIKSNLKEKQPMSKIAKLNFFRIRTKNNVWTYHYSPGVSVDIEITGELCEGKICMDEEKQKFSKIIKTYIDFIWMDDNSEVYYSSALDPLVRQPKK